MCLSGCVDVSVCVRVCGCEYFLSLCVDVSMFVTLTATYPDMCVSVFVRVCGCECICHGVWM